MNSQEYVDAAFWRLAREGQLAYYKATYPELANAIQASEDFKDTMQTLISRGPIEDKDIEQLKRQLMQLAGGKE